MSFIIILTILLIVETLADKVYLVNLATEESVELHNDHDALGTKNTLKSEVLYYLHNNSPVYHLF